MEVEAKESGWRSILTSTDLTILNLKNTCVGTRKLLTSMHFIAGKSELNFGADLPGESMLPFSLRSHLSLPGGWTSIFAIGPVAMRIFYFFLFFQLTVILSFLLL